MIFDVHSNNLSASLSGESCLAIKALNSCATSALTESQIYMSSCLVTLSKPHASAIRFFKDETL